MLKRYEIILVNDETGEEIKKIVIDSRKIVRIRKEGGDPRSYISEEIENLKRYAAKNLRRWRIEQRDIHHGPPGSALERNEIESPPNSTLDVNGPHRPN